MYLIVMSRLAQTYLGMASPNKDEVLGFLFFFLGNGFDVSSCAAKAR